MKASPTVKHKLAAILCGATCLLFAADSKPAGQVSKTAQLEFPSNGVVTLANSSGIVTVEGWDQEGVELTTLKSAKSDDPRDTEKAAKELDRVRFSTERHGDQLLIKTDSPRHGGSFNLEYQIKVPRAARLVVNHKSGEVNVIGVLGDIRVTARQGQILLRLPEERQYAIDAKSNLGSVVSDFPGQEKRKPWLFGHEFSGNNSAASQHLTLRTGYGDILILHVRIPPPLVSPPVR